MPIDPDIFVEAMKRVDDKGFAARVAHSSSLHMFRSALSSPGSAGSKVLKIGMSFGKASLKLIPIPILGDLTAAAVAKAEGWARGAHHKNRLNQATTKVDRVKFELKELSVENLDRYRWKVSEAVTEANAKVTAFNSGYCTCEEIFELVKTVAQAERRIRILKKEMGDILAVCSVTLDWLAECEAGALATASTLNAATHTPSIQPASGVIHLKNEIRTMLSDRKNRWDQLTPQAQAQALEGHKEACKNWCQFQDPNSVSGVNTNLAAARQWIATGTRVLTSPYTYESFVTVKGGDFEKEKN